MSSPGLHIILNLGTIIDPGPHITSGQTKSIVAGFDVNVALDGARTWSLLGEAAIARYLSGEPDEVTTSVGASTAVSPLLDLHAVALVGFLPQQDRVALLIGATQRFSVW